MAQLNNNTTVKAFGIFVRQAREKLELKQSEVAEKVGITQSYYSNIEAGKREIGVTLALNICDALGVEFNSFLQILTRKKPKVIRPTIDFENETENSPPQ